MSDAKLRIPTFEADFESIVDKIRKTGIITDAVLSGENTVLTTVNDLKENKTLLINGISCKVISASSTEITVNKDVVGATEWKAEFPFFMDGHISEISKRLKGKDESNDSVLKWQKYPLIILLQDIDYKKNRINNTEATIDFLIVNSTEQDYTTVQRRENNFIPILDPLYNDLITAMRDNMKFRISNDSFTASRKYFWGAIPQNKNPFNDRLDAIEITGLKLDLITNYNLNC